MQRIQNSFDELFSEAVTKGLESMFGQSGTEMVSLRLGLQNGGKDPADLHERLLSLFGNSGTLVIELRIINWLSSRPDFSFEVDNRMGKQGFLERNWKLASLAFENALRALN
jgi:hypothetical protein